MKAKLLVDCQNQHGDGVFWNPEDQCVWWTDIEGKWLWSYDPVSGNGRQISTPESVCCFAPRRGGGLIVAFADRISLFDLHTEAERKIIDFEPDNPATRLNGGRTDRQGRLIAGGMNTATGLSDSSVLRVNHDLAVDLLIEGVSCANATCFSPDGQTMFFADAPDKEIIAFDYDTSNGTVSNRRVHCSFANESGTLHGSCVDAEGGVWIAEWEGHRVVRVNADGNIDQVIDVPVWKPTCCAFGGPDLDTLFITTSRLLSNEEDLAKEPESGSLFAVKPGARGVVDMPFCG